MVKVVLYHMSHVKDIECFFQRAAPLDFNVAHRMVFFYSIRYSLGEKKTESCTPHGRTSITLPLHHFLTDETGGGVVSGRGKHKQWPKQLGQFDCDFLCANKKKKESQSMGNQIPPKHSLEEVTTDHTGPHVTHGGLSFIGYKLSSTSTQLPAWALGSTTTVII